YCATMDLVMRIPTTPVETQNQLDLVANAPMAIWRARQDSILASRRGNDRMRTDLADAHDANDALLAHINGQVSPGTVPAAPPPASPGATPPKAARRRAAPAIPHTAPSPAPSPRPKNTRSSGR